MVEDFAKIFRTPYGQLLVYRGSSSDGYPAVHVIGAWLDDVQPAAIMSWPEDGGDESADEAFRKVDQAMADEQARSLHNAVAGLATPNA